MLILYTSDDGKSRIQLRAKDHTVWLSQREMAQLFDVSTDNIGLVGQYELTVNEAATFGASIRRDWNNRFADTTSQLAQSTLESSDHMGQITHALSLAVRNFRV